ncbi:MAG: dTMP kinase [Deltaproteobacteria bacterium]|nr:dTMP kinase [Deltaproteobacteria bacterium]
MSLFITFEGIEGSGKSTQIRLLNDFLKLRGHETVLTREPGGTPIGDEIRHTLLSSENKEMAPLCELLLYAAGRAQHLAQVICPALKAGKTVLCDRFALATAAYQGFGRGLPLEMILKLNDIVLQQTKPDLTFLLDLDHKTGVMRARERNAAKGGKDEARFENEAFPFHQKVREGYLKLAAEDPARIVLIRGDRDVESVHQEIVMKVLGKLRIS